VPTTTELPLNPLIDEEIYFVAHTEPIVLWRLKYSAEGWNYVGGPPIISALATTDYQSSPTLQTWYSSWGGTQLLNHSVPLAGTYQTQYTASLIPESTPSNNEYLGFDVGLARDISVPPDAIEAESTGYFYTDMHSAPAVTATNVHGITFNPGTNSPNRVIQLVVQFNKSSNWYKSIRSKVVNQTLSILPAGPLNNW
jgi:hypothetical protein